MSPLNISFSFVLILVPGLLFASGSSHSNGHATDLFPAFVNVSLIIAFMVWKLKKPFTEYFNKKSKNISEVLERASIKAKEAEMMMKMQKEKNDNLKKEIDSINKDLSDMTHKYKSNYEQEVIARVNQLKKDATSRVEAEKRELFNELNGILITEVISKSKDKIKNDPNLNTKATQAMIQRLN